MSSVAVLMALIKGVHINHELASSLFMSTVVVQMAFHRVEFTTTQLMTELMKFIVVHELASSRVVHEFASSSFTKFVVVQKLRRCAYGIA